MRENTESVRSPNLSELESGLHQICDTMDRAEQIKPVIKEPRQQDVTTKTISQAAPENTEKVADVKRISIAEKKRFSLQSLAMAVVVSQQCNDSYILAKLSKMSLAVEDNIVQKPSSAILLEMQDIVRTEWTKQDFSCNSRKMSNFIRLVLNRREARLTNETIAERMNRIEGRQVIEIENLIDCDTLPFDFEYIKNSKHCQDLIKPTSSCDCNGDQCLDKCVLCAPVDLQGFECYTDGKLSLKYNYNVIFECNKRCRCDATCPKRVVQKGITCPLIIFKTKTQGWGVKTKNKIEKGTFVAEYTGELVPIMEVGKRKSYERFVEPKLVPGFPPLYIIDAAREGNVSRFFNHSNNPNLTSRYVCVDDHNLAAPRVAFFARKIIPENTQLYFDYFSLAAPMDYPSLNVNSRLRPPRKSTK